MVPFSIKIGRFIIKLTFLVKGEPGEVNARPEPAFPKAIMLVAGSEREFPNKAPSGHLNLSPEDLKKLIERLVNDFTIHESYDTNSVIFVKVLGANLIYTVGRPVIRKVLKTRNWGVPSACLGSR